MCCSAYRRLAALAASKGQRGGQQSLSGALLRGLAKGLESSSAAEAEEQVPPLTQPLPWASNDQL